MNAWRRIAWCFALAWLALLTGLPAAKAHETRPGYLELTETAAGQFIILWRTPVLAGMRLPVVLQLPDGVRNVREPSIQELSDSLVERRTIDVGPDGLAGKRIGFPGLQLTITDVLVRIRMLHGSDATMLVHPATPWVDIPISQGPLGVIGVYVTHGVEHILLGFDHLLFVLALILIVPGARTLLLTVTAFTVAHSITLSLATLGVVHLPGPPVEACIALSILLVASEILRFQRGEPSLTASRPWAVAFAFGLLHGFGFASALIDVGLPQHDIPFALFAFNVGVELGQLAFIAAVLGVIRAAKLLPIPEVAGYRMLNATSYAIGSVAAFLFIQKLTAF